MGQRALPIFGLVKLSQGQGYPVLAQRELTLKSRIDFDGGMQSLESRTNAIIFQQKQPHSNQSEIDGKIVPAAAACSTICCHLYHSDYCAAASARNLLILYKTPGTMPLQQSQPYFLNHLQLGQNGIVLGRSLMGLPHYHLQEFPCTQPSWPDCEPDLMRQRQPWAVAQSGQNEAIQAIWSTHSRPTLTQAVLFVSQGETAVCI